MARTPNDRIEKQARDWFIRLESGTLAPDEQERFADWLDEDPAHRAAYRQLDEFSRALVGVEQLASLSSLRDRTVRGRGDPHGGGWLRWLKRLAGSFTSRRVAVGWTVALLLVTGVSIVYLYPGMTTRVQPTPYATRTAETRDIELADGTVVSLGARTRVEVRYSDRQRQVIFAGGEAFFDVAPNAGRPFIVQAGETRVRVVGTRFNMRANTGRLDVAVAEGEVNITQPRESLIPFWGQLRPRQLALAAGEQVVAAAGEFEEVAPIKVEEVGSWRRGKLIYNDAPLGEVLADLRRYTRKDIVVADPGLNQLRLSAVLGTDQIDKMVVALSMLLPVEIDQSIPGIIVVSPQQAKNRQ